MIKKIGIRADGSKEKGMGHIIRCMALAKEFQNINIKVIFIIKGCREVEEIFKSNNIDYINIYPINLDDEIKIMKKIIEYNHLETIIIDSYWISDSYLLKIKNMIKTLISIDDNALYSYPSDIIINTNIYAKNLKYQLLNPNTMLILGSEYAILREEFVEIKINHINKNIKNILVTMGGSDINNCTTTILETIKHLPYQIYVIIGSSFTNIDELVNTFQVKENIHLIYNPQKISEVMNECDIAISASGTTTYELAVLGIPTILISQVENQINTAQKFQELNIMINLGNFLQISNQNLINSINNLANNYEKRLYMSEQSKKHVKRNGTKKIVDRIIQYIEMR